MKKKVFLYMYPIKEFFSQHMYRDDKIYDRIIKIPRPLPILDDVIDKRYRKKDYLIIYVLFPDTPIYELAKHKEDKKVYSNISFSEVNWDDEFGVRKRGYVPSSPDSNHILEQVFNYVKPKNISELVVSGFYSRDYVKEIAKLASDGGINTTIDLDLTEWFFRFYNKPGYLTTESYDPDRFYDFFINYFKERYPDIEADLYKMYGDPIYDMFIVDRSLGKGGK